MTPNFYTTENLTYRNKIVKNLIKKINPLKSYGMGIFLFQEARQYIE